MPITQKQAEKLLKGNYAFSLWSLSILVTRLKQLYANDPSESVLDGCTTELNAFVTKFRKIMGPDYSLIEGL